MTYSKRMVALRIILMAPMGLVVMVPIMSSCTRQVSVTMNRIDPKEAYGMSKNGFAALVDVREPDEVKEGAVPGAVNFPLSKIEDDTPDWREWVEKQKKAKAQIVLFCQAGGRAEKAAQLMASRGVSTSYFGGVDAWKEAGLPMVPAESASAAGETAK